MPHIKNRLVSKTILAPVKTVAMLLFLACATAPVEQTSPVVYDGNYPRSILVMPPVNLSPDVKAPLTFLATSMFPLAESGYYVIPVALSDETFKQNGVTVAEEANTITHNRLREIFGADAALYITVTGFGVRYNLINSIVEARASARLVDLRNGRELWSGQASSVSGEADAFSHGFEGIVVSLLSAAVNQVVNTLADTSFTVGAQANRQLLSAGQKNGIPYGPRHPRFVGTN